MSNEFNTVKSQTKTAQDNEYQRIARENEERIYNKPSIPLKVFSSLKKFFLSMYDWVSNFFSSKPETTKSQIAQKNPEIDAALVKQQADIDFLMQQHPAKRKEIDNLKSQMNAIENKIEIVENNSLLWTYNNPKRIGLQTEAPASPEAHIGPGPSSLRASG
jgi:hypothetical protein